MSDRDYALDVQASSHRTKVSEMILEFAAPLLNLDREGAADLEVLQSLMMLVEMCWNLPVFEVTEPALYARFKQGFDTATAEVPKEIADALAQLLVDRRSRYGESPVLIHVRVEADGADSARIVAEARMPSRMPRFS